MLMLSCAIALLRLSAFPPVRQKAFVRLLKEVLRAFLEAREGKPFILMLWSLECQYCPTELKMLSELKRSNPKMDVVLIATDTHK